MDYSTLCARKKHRQEGGIQQQSAAKNTACNLPCDYFFRLLFLLVIFYFLQAQVTLRLP
jgi:hypothetical protein